MHSPFLQWYSHFAHFHLFRAGKEKKNNEKHLTDCQSRAVNSTKYISVDHSTSPESASGLPLLSNIEVLYLKPRNGFPRCSLYAPHKKIAASDCNLKQFPHANWELLCMCQNRYGLRNERPLNHDTNPIRPGGLRHRAYPCASRIRLWLFHSKNTLALTPGV